MHRRAEDAAIGEGSLRDFRALTGQMARLGGGGVLLNVGSAVILPEVILKAFGILRNLGHDLTGFLGPTWDFVRHYRGSRQVVERVKELGGRGLALTGHHEIMLPLIAALVADRQGEVNPVRKVLDRQEVAAAMDRYRAAELRLCLRTAASICCHTGACALSARSPIAG